MFWKKPTADQELVKEIRNATTQLRLLGQEAKKRGITVWLKADRLVIPSQLYFDEAYRTNREHY